MITEDYVSFETAKLLKEKGFDWEESPFYCEQDRDEWRQTNSYTVPNPHYNSELPFDTEALTIIAPHVSLQMAMKWLREQHNITIVLTPSMFWGKYNAAIYKRDNEYPFGFNGNSLISSYEEACEVAIKYCLENLI